MYKDFEKRNFQASNSTLVILAARISVISSQKGLYAFLCRFETHLSLSKAEFWGNTTPQCFSTIVRDILSFIIFHIPRHVINPLEYLYRILIF